MFTAKHDHFVCKVGEPVRLTFNVTDRAGEAVTVAGANAVYKIARELGDAALLTKTVGAGVSLSGSQVVVSFLVSEIQENAAQAIGLFRDQLRVTKDGDDLVVANGSFTVEAVLT